MKLPYARGIKHRTPSRIGNIAHERLNPLIGVVDGDIRRDENSRHKFGENPGVAAPPSIREVGVKPEQLGDDGLGDRRCGKVDLDGGGC